MNVLAVSIAGMAVCFSDPLSLGRFDALGRYLPFFSSSDVCDLQIRLRPMADLPGRLPTAWSQVYSAGKWWSVYSHDSLLWFVVPLSGPQSDSQRRPLAARVISWSQQRATADIYMPAGAPVDPFHDLEFPFFGAFYAAHQGLMLHASAVDMNGQAWLFIGPSGAGKSHWTRYCRARGGLAFSEDRVVVRVLDGQVWAFGTPWHRRDQFHEPHRAPLRRIYFLRQAEPDQCEPASQGAAATLMLRAAVLPVYDSLLMSRILEVIDASVQQAAVFRLGYARQDGSLEL